MSERLEKIADEILAVVNKKRVSGETPEKDVWVATYLPNREQIAVIFGDREVSGSYVQKRFKKDDKQSIISELEKLYGDEPKNHNEEALGEDTVYDHSWYEVEKQKYPKRTKEGVIVKESGEYNPDVYGDSDITESVIKEDVSKINPKVLDELYDIISDQMGDMYMANYDEIDFDNLLDSVEDFGNDIDGYNPALKKDYALALKAKWEENHPSEGLEETTSAGCVASVGKPVRKVIRAACLPKRKKKKMSESIDSILFKESILNDMPCESKIEGHQFKYFMNEGKWYLSVDNCLVKTHDKDVMMETFDQIVDDEKVTTSLLEDYSCYEMELLMEDEDLTANPGSQTSELSDSPVSNGLQQPLITSVAALNQQVKDNEEERNHGQPDQPASALDKQKEQEYDTNELEKYKGQEVLHKDPEDDNKLKPVTLGDKFTTSDGELARMYKDVNGKLSADKVDAFSNKEELV